MFGLVVNYNLVIIEYFLKQTEVIEVACGYGETINKQKEMHRKAEDNKVFAQYRLYRICNLVLFVIKIK